MATKRARLYQCSYLLEVEERRGPTPVELIEASSKVLATVPLSGRKKALQAAAKSDWRPTGRAMALPRTSTYLLRTTPGIDLAWTLTDVLRDHSGIRERMITIRGRSGLGSYLGYKASGGRRFASGPDLYQEMREFLDAYCEEAKNKGARNVRLVFRALGEGDNFLVEPMARSDNRDVGLTRFSWGYEAPFVVYGVAGARKLDGIEAFLSDAQALAESATDAVNGVSAYVAQAEEYLTKFRALGDAFIAPVQAVGQLCRQVEGVATEAGSVLRLPADIVDAVLASVESASTAAAASLMLLPFVDRATVRSAYYAAQASLGELRRQSSQYLGHWQTTTAGSQGTNPGAIATRASSLTESPPAQKTSPVAVHTVRAGETLRSIAAEAGVTPQELAILNGMPDFSTLPGGAPLSEGAQIQVPTPTGLPAQANSQGAATPTEVFGVDILLTPGYDWALLGDDPQDFATVRGTSLLKQALQTRLQTVVGEHGAFPAYGLPRLVGEAGDATTAGRLASAAREQCLRDARIADVDDLGVEDGGDRFIVQVALIARTGPRFDLSVPMPGG